MSWSYYRRTDEIVQIFQNSQLISIGSHHDCEIVVKNANAIHAQIIFDDCFLFFISHTDTKVYFLEANLRIEKEEITIKYNENFNFQDKSFWIQNDHNIFLSDEFLKLLSFVQNTFFDFHTLNVEMKKISISDVISHGSKILVTEIFHKDFAFDLQKRMKFKKILWCLWAQIFEYSILTPAILDPDISEIMVNGYQHIYFEKFGKIVQSNIQFLTENNLLSLIERICASIGRRIDESMPYCDARLKEGHRVHAIISPLSLNGPCLTIRKFPNFSYTIEKLIAQDSLTFQAAEFLKSAILDKKNIIISGGTGSGKTTLLNCLSVFIPATERILTIEDSAELQLQQPHVVRLECRNENIENQGKITIRDLVKNSLRMRPDRIIVGECRGAEALDMLQAMNTGHDGSITTLHANSPQDALRRLETLVLFSEIDLPSRAIREQMASAIHIIVQQSRLSCGKRCVTKIEKIIGFDDKASTIKTDIVYEK